MTPQQRAAFTAAEAGLLAVNESLRTLRALLEPVAIDPPPPTPEPPPPAPGALRSRPMNMAAVMQIGSAVSGDRYRRFRVPMILAGDVVPVRLRVNNMAAGGGTVPLEAVPHVLSLDGSEVARITPVAGQLEVTYTLPLSGVSEGWHLLDITGPLRATPMPQHVYVRKGASAAGLQSVVPIMTHEQAFEFAPREPGAPYLLHWGTVPANGKPTPRPIKLGEAVPFDHVATRAELACDMLVPWRGEDIHEPTVTDDGVLTTDGRQSYFWGDFTAALPVLPLHDGPRGVGTVSMPTHLQWGRNAKLYFCDPWRVGKVSPDGTVTTLAGWRSQDPPSHWTAKRPRYDLVGDWSDVHADRRGFHELWGMAWDDRTLAVDEGAEPIPAEGNEKPHVTGPVLFVADSQNNRICRLSFDPRSHGPARVTEFITGLADPWDVVCANGVLYVSERKAHRIVAYNATTGAYLRTVVYGADLGTVNHARFPGLRAGITLAQAQREDVVLPEGLYLHDGWLYYGSRVMAQIKRVHLQSGAVEVVRNLLVDGNSYFVKFAVSDGTFGPRGSLFVSTWSVGYFSFPHAYAPSTPAGKAWEYLTTGTSRGGMWAPTSYSTAVAVGGGRMACGGVHCGVNVIRKALPTDRAFNRAAVNAGRIQWFARGHYLLHGPGGYGYHGLPLPWGETAEMDEYLRFCGHEVGR